MSDDDVEDPMISWKQRKANLKAAAASRQRVRNQNAVKKTNAWRRLRREAQEAAQNPDNLHNGWTMRKGDRDA